MSTGSQIGRADPNLK